MNSVLRNKRLHKKSINEKKTCFNKFNLNYIIENILLCFKSFNSVNFYIHNNFQLNE